MKDTEQNPGVPIMDAEAIRRALRRIAHEIIEQNADLRSVVLAGIPLRGVEIARRLAELIREVAKIDIETGTIDVAMHRDDVGTRAELPVVHASKLPLPLGLRELSPEEINFILETADAFKQVGTREIKKVPALRGKTMVNFFVEPSTRTRTSFELAAHRLSADVINISATTSSLTKGETLKDTARNLEALHADILVLRHSSAGAPQFLAQRLKSSVINAGDGAHEHPTQGLLDLYTIREKRGRVDNLHVVIVGDILFSRVARSNIFGLTKLGAHVTLVGPSTLVPPEFEKLGVEVSHKIDNVLPSADVVNLLRIQHERQRKEYFPGIGEYTRFFGLTKERAKLLKPDCLIMHPGPINRGVEIDSGIADGLQSVILDQVTNGLAVRMAVLYLCGGIST